MYFDSFVCLLVVFLLRDPQAVVEIAGALYSDESFYESLFNGLSEDGVFVAQVRVVQLGILVAIFTH